MRTSQNGYPVLTRTQCSVWEIPVRNGDNRHYVLAPGIQGFVLAHAILWWHEVIEPINKGTWDEWGWADRPIRASDETSNHASGTAADVNAVTHPLGAVGTFRTRYQMWRIRHRLQYYYCDVIDWGGDYHSRKDEMHIELAPGKKASLRRVGRKLLLSRSGRRIMAVNRNNGL